MNYIIGLCFLFTLLIPIFTFAIGFTRRKNFCIRFCVMLVIDVGLAVLLELLRVYSSSWIYYLTVALYIGIAMASVAVCFKLNVASAMFILIGGYSVQHLSDCITSIMHYYFRANAWIDALISIICVAIISIIVYFPFIRKANMEANVKAIDITSIFFTATVLIVDFGINELARALIDDIMASRLICKLYAAISCILVLYVEFNYFKRNELQYEKIINEQMFRERQRQFEVFSSNNEQMNIKFHDLKARLNALTSLDNPEERKKYVEELKTTLSVYAGRTNTDNKAMDTVLSEKILQCVNDGIEFNYKVEPNIFGFIGECDLYVLFSNALDNAIESVMAEEKQENRIINLSCLNRNGYAYINLSNYCSAEITFKDGLPVTRKSADYHGFGTRSIRQIVKKYGGEVKMSCVDNLFRLEILFMNI